LSVPAKRVGGARKLVGHTGYGGRRRCAKYWRIRRGTFRNSFVVEVLNDQGAVERFSNKDCSFGYRDSIFKHNLSYVVVRAAFALSTNPKPKTSYKDLAKLFNDPPRLGETGSSADLGAIRSAVLSIRAAKFPDLAVEGTAGSFFENPIVSKEEARTLRAKYPELPLFDMPETAGVKVPVAWLMDHVLHMHGATVGGARLYEKQILVIAAKRNTSSADVQMIAKKVIEEVKEKCNIEINQK